ncbi:MAG TPA: glutamate--tRNA ligase [Polyangiaceae bacterium]|jgi:glutamyl-tRNA synthetase|nr:glutamate--tRNA ligase [Polyangiaceae bacterium]
MQPARVRFAPSPTGYLHIGGVRTALFNWLWARKTGGTFVLRIEDTDQQRSTRESLEIIFDALRWVGLVWDEGPQVSGPRGPYTQMERLGIYKAEGEKLICSGKAYRCYCTKEELDAQRAALKARDPKAQFRYPGTCRSRTDAPDLPFVVRFKVPETGNVTYVDKVFGEVVTPNAAQQDFVLLRSDGVPLYNFGAVVDDATMGITLVARGRDHMVNTPPQIMLYEALGAPAPVFAHLPMMLAPNGEKLSKRHGAVSVTEYRDQGYSPHAVLNYLARFGWSHGDQEVFSIDELVAAFDWEHCNRSDGKFDAKKFLAINHEHLKTPRLTADDEYARRTLPFVKARGLETTEDAVRALVPLIRERATTFVDAADRLDFVFRDPPAVDAAGATKFLVPASAAILRAMADAIAAVETWTAPALEAAVNAWLPGTGLPMKDVAQPARVALTGRTASPGLFDVIAVLGRERALQRLRAAADKSEAARP